MTSKARSVSVLAVVVAAFWATPGRGVAAAPTPRYSDVSAVGKAGAAYKPLVINSSNQMVGLEPNGQPFFVNAGVVHRPAMPKHVTCWQLTGLNNSGQVAGWEETGASCTAPIQPITGSISSGSLSVSVLDSAGGASSGCSAISVNDAGVIAGMCDAGGSSYVAEWSKSTGYGDPTLLKWPAATIAPPALDGPPPAFTRMIDDNGDVIGQARCALNSMVSVGVVWTSGAGAGALFEGRNKLSTCSAPVSDTVPTRVNSIASHVDTGGAGASGLVYAVGACRISGAQPGQNVVPCYWLGKDNKGKVIFGAPVQADSSKGSQYASLTDVNGNGWSVGSEGNPKNTTALWIPKSTGSRILTIHPLHKIIPIGAWVVPGPICGGFGADSISERGSIAGVGKKDKRGTGFLLTVKSHAAVRGDRRGVSGTGCQE